MPRQRPGSVTAAAVMAIVYGTLFTFCNLCGLAGQGLNKNLFGGGDPQQAQLQKQIEEALDRDVPLYSVVQLASPIIGLVFALAFLSAGLGLLGMHSWARLLAIATAVFIVLFNIVQSIYQLVFFLPAMDRVFTDVLPNAMPKGPAPMPVDIVQVVKISMMVGVVIGLIIQIAVILYLLVIVFLLLRHNARAAFAGTDELSEAVTASPDLDYADDGWGKSAPPEKPPDDTRIK
jgi:hypothetical protein